MPKIQNNSPIDNSKILFLTAFGLYLFYTVIFQNALFDTNEIFMEEALHYFDTAHRSSFLENLFSSNEGNINLLARIYAYFIEHSHLPIEKVSLFYHLYTVTFVGIVSTLICLPIFKVVISSNTFRFLLAVTFSLMLGVTLKTLYNYSYVNLLYFSLISVYLLVSMNNKIQVNNKLIALSPFLILSKVHVLVFLPIFIYCYFKSKNIFSKTTRAILLISIMLALLQLTFLIYVDPLEHSVKWANQHKIPISIILESFIYFSTSNIFASIFGIDFFIFLSEYNFWIPSILGLLITLISLFCFNKIKDNSKYLVFVGLYLCYGYWFIQVFGKRDLFNVMNYKTASSFLYFDMWNLIGGWYGSILFLSGIFCFSFTSLKRRLNNFFHIKSIFVYSLFLFFIFNTISYSLVIGRTVGFPWTRVSQWSKLAGNISMNNKDPLCIPIAGAPRLYKLNDCDYLGSPASDFSVLELKNIDNMPLNIKIDKDVHNGKVYGLGIGVNVLSSSQGAIKIILEIETIDGPKTFELYKPIQKGKELIFIPFDDPLLRISSAKLQLSSGVNILTKSLLNDPYIYWVGIKN